MSHDLAEFADEFSPLQGYAAWASCYDDDGNPLIPLEGPAVREILGPVAGRVLLDLGCGTGRHALALAESGAEVVAVDQSEPMMARGRSRPLGESVRWVCHALPEPLPLPDASFDGALMGLVAEHVADLGRVFGDLHRLVRPGGRLVLSALHPERTAAGQRARFIDPSTGLRRPITTIHRTSADYQTLAAEGGWRLVAERDLVVPLDLIKIYPRAEKYLGRPLGLVLGWEKPISGPA